MSIMNRFSTVTFALGMKLPSLDDVIAATQHAEKLGFYSINLPMAQSARNSLDIFVVLPALVQATSRIRIAVDAVPAYLVPPFDLAKYFASLDVISGGRVILGMCLGYGQEAFDIVGAQQKYRGRMADEQLEAITRLWKEDKVDFEGTVFSFKNATVDPKPIQNPMPIWLGGRTKSIPRASKYCEYLNTLWPTPDEVRNEYIPQLNEENAKWGTNAKLSTWLFTRITDHEMSAGDTNEWFKGIINGEVTATPSEVAVAGTPEQCAARFKEYMDAGVDRFVLDQVRHSIDPLEVFYEQTTLFAEKVAPLLES